MSSAVAKNTVFLTLASVAQKLLSFVYFLIIARVMGSENTGGYFLALSLITIAQVVADAGLSNVVTRSVASGTNDAVSAVRRALGVKIPAAILACVIAVVASQALSYDVETQLLVLLALPILLSDSISLLCYAALRGLHTLAYESLGLFLGQAVTLAAGSAALMFAPSNRLLIFALLCGSLFNTVLSIRQLVKRLGPSVLKPDLSVASMRGALKESFPFLLAAVFVKLYSSLDVQFLYRNLGQAAVGVYGVAYKYTYAFQFVPLAFSAALYPRLSALIGQGDRTEAAHLLERAFRYMLVIGVPLAFGLMAVAEPAILLAGEEYRAGIAVLSIMPLALIPSFLDIPVGSVLNAAHRQMLKTGLFGMTLVINAILNTILIPKFGMMGAAYASIVSLTILFLSGFSMLPKILPTFRLVQMFRLAIPPFVSAVAMFIAARGVVMMADAPAPVELMLAVPVGGVVYAICLTLLGGITRVEVMSAVASLRRKPVVPYADPAPDA